MCRRDYKKNHEASMGAQKSRVLGYDFIRALATLLIIVFHFYTTCKEQGIPVLPEVICIVDRGSINFGGIGVALFFMLSGALLIRQKGEPLSVIQFYKRRLSRILVPQWIAFAFSFTIAYIINHDIMKIGILDIFISFMGLNYCSIPWSWWGFSPPWLIGEWFTAVIILIYLVFPIVRKLFNHHRILGTLLVVAVFAVNLKAEFLSGGNGYFSKDPYLHSVVVEWYNREYLDESEVPSFATIKP